MLLLNRPIPACAIRRAGRLLVAGGALLLSGLPASAVTEVPRPLPGAPEICDPATGPALPPFDPAQPASTRKMAELLDRLRREADPTRNPFRNTEQVQAVQSLLLRTRDPQQQLELRMHLAQDLLSSGRPEEALRENEAIEGLMRDAGAVFDARTFPEMLTAKAMCWMRIGEQENCVAGHNADSCLFPIQGGGVHLLKRGARGAVENFTELLTHHPGDLRARWLLNIAYMTLGEYPDKVPPKWLIPPKLFASDYDIKRFPDVAGAVGLDLNDLAGGVVLEDFDHDGFLDLMCSAWGLADQMRLFRSNGDGTFTERTKQAGLLGEVGGLNMIHGDFNNDGYADVLVLRGGWLRTEGHLPNSLLRNNGDFTFTDVTEQAGLLSFHPTQTAVWFDYNGDGFLDIFIGNESTGRDENPCELFRNNGDGTFTECAAAHGLDFIHFVKGTASGDFNNDGRPDLYLSRRDGPKILLRNDGPAGADRSPRGAWKFTDVSDAAGVTEPDASFPCWFWDYDNDGWQDIMVTGYQIQDVGDIAADYLGRPHVGQRARLYRNNRDGTFTNVSRECGVNKLLHTMGCNFGDLDNDGWLDFYVGTGDPDFTTLIPNRMFRNDGGKRFQDVTTSGGFGQLQKGHGIAFGDIDNDGDQDIYSSVGGAVEADMYHNQLFANPGHGNHWLKLLLEGVQTNRVAIGARVRVVVLTPAGERSIHRTVGSGASFGSSGFRQEIGLGDAQRIVRVEIFWPVSGRTQVLDALELDRAYSVREGAAAAQPLALRSFVLPAAAEPGVAHAPAHSAMAP